MSDFYGPLFEAIRTKCQQQHWFGADCFNPKQYEDILVYDPDFDRHTLEREIAPADDPNRFGFVFPPASEEQLQQTEEHIGFPLPPLLRALYAKVANGGFGPGMGLNGALGGYKGPYFNHDFSLATQHPQGTFNYAEFRRQAIVWGERVQMQVPQGQALDGLLHLCDIGCCQDICIDREQHTFIVAPLENDEFYALEQLPWTFEEWLWRWARDEDIYSWS